MREKMMLQRSAPVQTQDSGNFYLNPVSLPTASVQLAVKRFIDAGSALVSLFLLAPAFLLLAVLIKLSSKGPVFSRILHTGLNGAPFEMLAFRCNDIGSGGSNRLHGADDQPLTPIGRFLRATNLDTLPRLWNVLAGDMSLIGPAAHVPDMRAAGHTYSDLVRGYENRQRMRPGLTGLAQTQGLHVPAQRWTAIRQIVADIDYISRFSLFLDMKILMRTAINAVSGRTGL